MLNGLYQHWRACTQAIHRLINQPLGTLLAALVVGIALSLPAGGYLLLNNATTLVRGISGTPEISLFMNMQATQTDIHKIEQKLKSEPLLASYRYVSRQEALKQLEMGGLGDVLGGLTDNPLPDAFIVSVRDDNPEIFEHMSTTMQSWPGVAHVQHDSAWVKRLNALLNVGQSAILILAALLGFALVIVTFNTIRLQILTQRQEIEISRLLGATDPFIRRPFYWFGILQGMLGGGVALGVVWLGMRILTPAINSLAQSYGIVWMLNGPHWQETFSIVAFAAFLGWLGSAISVRRHLSENK